MKILYAVLWLACISVYGQSTFCDGWEDGYAAGKKSKHDNVYITPICPIPGIGEDTYQVGYSKGYEKATGQASTLITPDNNKKEDAFCNGWEKGFASAMAQNNKSLYIVPICPIAKINEESYDDGFARGYQRGLDELGLKTKPEVIVSDENGKDFCEGWERGFQYGLELWAIEHNQTKPRKNTPLCPIPKLNEDTYSKGFELGKLKAKEVAEE